MGESLFSKFKVGVLIVFVTGILGLTAIALMPSSAQAITATKGAKAHTLNANTTYTKYDATGDRRADTIRISASGSSTYAYEKLSVSINGKTAFSKKTWFYYVETKLMQLKNGKCFFYLYAPMDNGDAEVCAIYQVKNGKLKRAINLNTGFGTKIGNHTSGEVSKVSGNTMSVKFNVMAYMSGLTNATYSYKYKSGALRRTSKFGKLTVTQLKNNSAKTKKAMTAYKSTTCKSKKFTIKKGQSVKFLKAYVKGNTVRYQVRVAGKTGWIKVANKYGSPLMYKYLYSPGFYLYEPPFEGTFLAG